MRQGTNSGRRPRGRTNRKQQGGGGGQGGQSRTHTFDSNGPDGRVRGNARQVYEKYLTLARDATSAGDRVAAEAYYQHAEHYFRILSESTDPQSQQRRNDDRQTQFNGNDEAYDGDDDQSGSANGRTVQSESQPAPNHRNAAPTPAEAQPEVSDAVGGNEVSDGQEAEAAPRPRRSRPRKPRTSEGNKPAQQETAAETEDGPAVS